MISTGITRNRPPGLHDAEQRQHRPCEDVALRRAAPLADRLARSAHVGRLGGRRRIRVQREIRLHAGAQIEVAIVEQRPAACAAWMPRKRRAILPLSSARPARRGSVQATRLRPGWWRRPRARTPSGRQGAEPPARRRPPRRSTDPAIAGHPRFEGGVLPDAIVVSRIRFASYSLCAQLPLLDIGPAPDQSTPSLTVLSIPRQLNSAENRSHMRRQYFRCFCSTRADRALDSRGQPGPGPVPQRGRDFPRPSP